MIVCGSKGIPYNILIRACADKENRYGGLLKAAKALRIKNTIGKEFSEIAAKHILDSYLTPMSEKCESAKKAYEVFPKVDEEYIAKLSREEAEIKEKTAKAALQLKANAEEEKIRVQKAMKSAQDKALKQQNDYFREQTENIKAQAKAAAEQARHAEQMAKYMEQNAKEAEDIRRRMDDEGFGRNRRI